MGTNQLKTQSSCASLISLYEKVPTAEYIELVNKQKQEISNLKDILLCKNKEIKKLQIENKVLRIIKTNPRGMKEKVDASTQTSTFDIQSFKQMLTLKETMVQQLKSVVKYYKIPVTGTGFTFIFSALNEMRHLINNLESQITTLQYNIQESEQELKTLLFLRREFNNEKN